MKILFISAGDDKYGAPRSLMELMIELKNEHQIEPILLTKKYNLLNKQCTEIGIENHSMWYADIMAGASYNSKVMRIIKHIVKYSLYILGKFSELNIERCGINFNEIDIVHTNLNVVGIGSVISKKYNIPHVWHLRVFGKEDYNVVHYKRNCYEYMNHHADRFITISKGVEQAWCKNGISKEKTCLIYNGIVPEKFPVKVWKEKQEMKIVMVGHIQPKKGQIQLIEALKLLPSEVCSNIKVDFIGEPYREYYEEIKKSLEECSIKENIQFIGYVENVNSILKDYDIGVNCSMAEGFGRITVEYMAAKLLVIASDTGANPEIIENNQHGLLFKYGDVKDLARKIEFAYFNRDRIEELADNGFKRVNKEFTVKKTAERVMDVYREIVKK